MKSNVSRVLNRLLRNAFFRQPDCGYRIFRHFCWLQAIEKVKSGKPRLPVFQHRVSAAIVMLALAPTAQAAIYAADFELYPWTADVWSPPIFGRFYYDEQRQTAALGWLSSNPFGVELSKLSATVDYGEVVFEDGDSGMRLTLAPEEFQIAPPQPDLTYFLTHPGSYLTLSKETTGINRGPNAGTYRGTLTAGEPVPIPAGGLLLGSGLVGLLSRRCRPG